MQKGLKPGNKFPNSGQYVEVGKQGARAKVEITGVEGKTVPPTRKPRNTFDLVDKTKHKDR